MAQYIKQEIRDVTNKDAKRVYYRIASRGNVGQEDLLNEMCAHGRTGLNRGNVKAVLTLLAETMQYFLTQGYSVTIDDIGNFSLSLGLKKGKEEEDLDSNEAKRNAQSIHVNGVNFKVNKHFLREIDQKCKLERAGVSRMNRSPFTKEERMNKAVDFLKAHGIMRVDDYVSITKLPKSTACRELREMVRADGTPFKASGRGSSLVYMLND
jgi:predicted histone-like DNA-binding protein